MDKQSASCAITECRRRICAEFREMPGLQLTREQLRRLCAVDGDVCDLALEQLESTHFLRRSRKGTFVRDVEVTKPMDIKVA
jgi:hypothetical protein